MSVARLANARYTRPTLLGRSADYGATTLLLVTFSRLIPVIYFFKCKNFREISSFKGEK